ncbi:MAG: acireductone synthase [Alphaproteobacteria bacterium]
MDQEIKAIVTDIEGTTSAISFVKDTLFPFAYKHLPDYIWDNEAELTHILDAVREEERNSDLSTQELIEVMLRYIDEDKKVTPLKTLQGSIWEEGYKSGELIGHVYDDALEGLRRWKEQGIKLYVYSSGSVPAQKLLFGHTKAGDLNTLFSGYFDTNTGAKKDVRSYEKIAKEIRTPAENVLFLSDSTDEIAAASDAGMNVIILDREKALIDTLGYTVTSSFDDILNEAVIEA